MIGVKASTMSEPGLVIVEVASTRWSCSVRRARCTMAISRV